MHTELIVPCNLGDGHWKEKLLRETRVQGKKGFVPPSAYMETMAYWL